MRLERTTLYVAASVIVSLVGLVVLQAGRDSAVWLSISTSLIAAGLSSVAFATIKYLDDRNSDRTGQRVEATLGAVLKTLKVNGDSLQGLRRNLALAAATEGRVFDRHPETEVAELLDDAEGDIEVDACGLTLWPFYRDQFARIESKSNLTVRLLVQHPGLPAFSQLCRQESRDHKRMIEEVIEVTKAVLQAQIERRSDTQFQIRWFEELPTATMVRVGGVIYARPRFLREGHQARVFYERYILEEGAPFEVYKSYFLSAWDSSVSPTLDNVKMIQRSIGSGSV